VVGEIVRWIAHWAIAIQQKDFQFRGDENPTAIRLQSTTHRYLNEAAIGEFNVSK